MSQVFWRKWALRPVPTQCLFSALIEVAAKTFGVMKSKIASAACSFDVASRRILPSVRFVQPIYHMNSDLKIEVLTLDYVLDNKLDKDYSLSTTDTFMLTFQGNLEQNNNYGIAENCFIPARQKVKCGIKQATPN